MTRTECLVGLVIASVMAVTALSLTAAQPDASSDERAVLATVEDFLERLGNRQVDTLAADFTEHGLIVVSRQQDGVFVSTTRTATDWLQGLRASSGGQPFQEPLDNITVTVESGALAHLRADFEVVRDGQVLSSGVDHFTLARGPNGWKIAVVAYTSIPR